MYDARIHPFYLYPLHTRLIFHVCPLITVDDNCHWSFAQVYSLGEEGIRSCVTVFHTILCTIDGAVAPLNPKYSIYEQKWNKILINMFSLLYLPVTLNHGFVSLELALYFAYRERVHLYRVATLHWYSRPQWTKVFCVSHFYKWQCESRRRHCKDNKEEKKEEMRRS